MKALFLLLSLCLLSVASHAQEQMALRLNEKGIMKLLRLAVKYNTASDNSKTVIIPGNTYRFTVPRSQLNSNPLIPILNEVSDVNMNRDLPFYFHTSDVRVDGSVDEKSLKAEIFNSNEKGFDLRLSLNLPQISINGQSLSLCETKARNGRGCGTGLKATMNGLRINTTSRPVSLSIVLRLRTDGEVARVTVRSVHSNLESRNAPGLNLNFRSLDIPKISIVINGQESELDTSRLKDRILNYRTFLGKKLLAFAGDFIANDLAEMLNVYLINKEVATSYQLYRRDNAARFDEFLTERQDMQFYHPQDNTYVRPPVYIPLRNQAPKPQATMMAQIADLVRSAQLDLSLKKISTPGNKDIELAGLLNFVLNGKRIRVGNKLGNSNRSLPALNLSSQRNHDINLAISEPLINGALDLANSTRLFQEVYEKISPVKGFSIRSVKLHFAGNRTLVAVINAQIDLKKIESDGVTSWFKNKIAAWMERNNNNSVIYFPIEVAVVPVFKRLPNGASGMDLRVLSPFGAKSLPNRFNYPSNVPDMTETVREGVMEELRASLEEHTNKTYSINLSNFLDKSGVVFLPRTIAIDQGAYLLLGLDIVDIKFNSKNPNLR